MKKMLLLFCTATACLQAITPSDSNRPQPILLEYKALHLIDGNFINADIIELIRRFRNELYRIMKGERVESGYKGKYLFNGNYYGVRMLNHKHKELEQHRETIDEQEYTQRIAELNTALEQAKHDFITIADRFKKAVAGAKQIMESLILESTTKRNRSHSLLNMWAKTKEEDEVRVFNEQIQTLQLFDEFCLDLLNFLEDLVHSCPKAYEQFELRAKKFDKILRLLEQIQTLRTLNSNTDFLKFIKGQLDKIALEEINSQYIQQLHKSWMAQK